MQLYSHMSNLTKLLTVFKFAASNLSYYQQILKEKEIDPSQVIDQESFNSLVPVISKQDVFMRFNADALFTEDQLEDFTSAIVSSGTSGVFSYGLVSKEAL